MTMCVYPNLSLPILYFVNKRDITSKIAIAIFPPGFIQIFKNSDAQEYGTMCSFEVPAPVCLPLKASAESRTKTAHTHTLTHCDIFLHLGQGIVCVPTLLLAKLRLLLQRRGRFGREMHEKGGKCSVPLFGVGFRPRLRSGLWEFDGAATTERNREDFFFFWKCCIVS